MTFAGHAIYHHPGLLFIPLDYHEVETSCEELLIEQNGEAADSGNWVSMTVFQRPSNPCSMTDEFRVPGQVLLDSQQHFFSLRIQTMTLSLQPNTCPEITTSNMRPHGLVPITCRKIPIIDGSKARLTNVSPVSLSVVPKLRNGTGILGHH